MNWSLHDLLGQKVHYDLAGGVCDVCDDPLLGKTAHGFTRNLAGDGGKFISSKLRRLEGMAVPGIRSILLHPPKRSSSHFLAWLDVVRGRGHGVIYVHGPRDWEWRFGRRYRSGDAGPATYGHAELRDRIVKSAQDRGRMMARVATPGRLREYLALGFGSLERKAPTPQQMRDRGFHVMEFGQWLERPEQSILALMGGLGLRVREDRLPRWRGVAGRWSAMVRSEIGERDAWWNNMVQAVALGRHHDCGQLDLMQEGMLVRDVLRYSGRMIRARQLDRLPRDARDIHQLIR